MKATAEQSMDDDTSTGDFIAGVPVSDAPQGASTLLEGSPGGSPQGIPRRLPPLEKEISAGLAACAGSMKTKAVLFRDPDGQKSTEK